MDAPDDSLGPLGVEDCLSDLRTPVVPWPLLHLEKVVSEMAREVRRETCPKLVLYLVRVLEEGLGNKMSMESPEKDPRAKAVEEAMKRVEMMRDRAMMYLGDATEFIVLARGKDGKVVQSSAFLDPAPWVCVLEDHKMRIVDYYRHLRGSESIVPGEEA